MAGPGGARAEPAKVHPAGFSVRRPFPPGSRGTAPQVFSGTAVAERQSLSGDPGGLACLPVQGSLHWVQCLQSTASDRVEPL